MKKSDLVFGATLVPLDYVLMVLAGLGAYVLRFSNFYIENVREATVIISFPDYFRLVLLLAVVWLVIFAFAGLYNLRGYRSRLNEIGKVFLACSTGILTVVIFIFLNRELFASRFIVLAAWMFAFVLVGFGRLVARSMRGFIFRHGVGLHEMVIIGSNTASNRLSHFFESNKQLGYHVSKRLSDFTVDKIHLLNEYMVNHVVDEVILAETELPKEQRYDLINFVVDHNLDFRYVADLMGMAGVNVGVEVISDVPVVEVKKTPLEGWGKILKRLFDILFSFIGLVLLFVPLFFIALVVKIDSRGSVFYNSFRVGDRGQKFYLLKFRSMCQNAHELKRTELKGRNERGDGPLFKLANDPRVTRVGGFLRKWSIDELPQLWNVFIGEISLVGPRPHEPEEVSQYERRHRHLLDIKPGVTGLAQVSGRSDLSFEDEVKLDTYYIENWSLWLDVKILLQTPRAVLMSRKAE